MNIEHQCAKCSVSFHGRFGASALVDHHRLVHAPRTPMRSNRAPLFEVIHEDCPTCLERGAPSHDGSTRCESFSIASGGDRAHCSCDTCF